MRHDVVYGHARGALRLDLYAPVVSNNAPRRAIVWIHGGGFREGSKEGMAIYAEDSAARGYVSVSINYRLAKRITGAEILAAQHDAQAAVRWLRRNAKRLGVNPNRVYVGGVSAGAVTALRVAYDARSPGRSGNPGYSSRVASAIAISGAVYDASLIRSDGAPVMYLHGRRDHTVDYGTARRDCHTARAVGLRCRFVSFPGIGHELAWTRLEKLEGIVAAWMEEKLPHHARVTRRTENYLIIASKVLGLVLANNN